MSDYFPGFGISGYRSFGDDVQWVRLHEHTTVILGPNNSGKSNVLRLIQDVAPHIKPGSQLKLNDFLDFKHAGSGKIRVHWPLRADAVDEAVGQSKRSRDIMKAVVAALSEPDADALPHVAMDWTKEGTAGEVSLEYYSGLSSLANLTDSQIRQLSSDFTGRAGDSNSNVQGILTKLAQQASYKLDPPISVAALRYIRAGSEGETIDGSGMVDDIRSLRSPSPEDVKAPEVLKDLCDSVGRLLDLDNVELVVPHDSDELSIRHDGKSLPLSSLGTGTEHALIILTAAIVNPGRVVCVEEPELHLHPRLQRRLIATLAERAKAQLILTSHSATFVDMSNVGFIRVKSVDGETKLDNVDPSELIHAVRDLGVRASDLLQANFLIWVEGPSDRIYLRRWLEIEAPDLEENRDYSIVFSGGGLISHLGTGEDNELVDIRRLNQNFAIMADSDDEANPKAAITRLKTELGSEDKWRLWQTAGRTIENLVNPDILDQAIKSVHPTSRGVDREGDANDKDLLTRIKTPSSYLKSPKKVQIAMASTQLTESIDEFRSLKKWIGQIVDAIREASI